MIDWADGCLPQWTRRRMMGRRKYRAEGSFTDAANRHGYKRARWRGLKWMTIQNLIIATVQNSRKLVRDLPRSRNSGCGVQNSERRIQNADRRVQNGGHSAEISDRKVQKSGRDAKNIARQVKPAGSSWKNQKIFRDATKIAMW